MPILQLAPDVAFGLLANPEHLARLTQPKHRGGAIGVGGDQVPAVGERDAGAKAARRKAGVG